MIWWHDVVKGCQGFEKRRILITLRWPEDLGITTVGLLVLSNSFDQLAQMMRDNWVSLAGLEIAHACLKLARTRSCD